LFNIKISWLLSIWTVSVVSIGNDWVEEFLESFVAFLITSNDTAGLNVGMSWVVNTSFNAVRDSATTGGLSVLDLSIEVWLSFEYISQE